MPLPPDADPPFPPTYPYLFSTGEIYGRDHLSQNIRMSRGDTYKFTAAITLNGSPVDLTGGVVRMTAKWAYSDSDSGFVFQLASNTSGITITSAPQGQILVTISKFETASLPSRPVDLVYDIQFINSSGEVSTVASGIITVVPDVTVNGVL